MGETRVHQRVMKSIEGKFVALQNTREGPKLCVVDQQNNAPSVYIVTRKNQMALRFRLGGSDYVTMVDGNKLAVNKLETSCDETDLPDSHWFEKDNVEKAGEHYSLRTVAQPTQYLCINFRHYIILSEDSDKRVLVTDKKP